MSDPFDTTADDPFAETLNGGEYFAFENVGDTHSGVVIKNKESNDTTPDGIVKTWPNGDPVKMYIFTLDTDEGPKSLYVRGHMFTAVREAAKTAGLRSVIGQKLTVKHTGLGEVKTKGYKPAKLFAAKFESAPARQPADAGAGANEPW